MVDGNFLKKTKIAWTGSRSYTPRAASPSGREGITLISFQIYYKK
jgi:hypothetical protein